MNKIFNITQDFKHYYFYFLGIRMSFSKKGFGKIKNPDNLAGHPILTAKEATDCIYEVLNKKKPCFITRFGATEILTIEYFQAYKNENNFCEFPDYIKDNMRNQAGFFTPTNELLSKFCQDSVDMVSNMDILGVWNCFCKNNGSEEPFIKNYASKDIKLVNMWEFIQGAFKQEIPWMRVLEGKKVLVIHPFEKSIVNQYSKHEKLFENKLILPNFQLETIKAIQGIDTNNIKNQYKDWFDALENMYKQIDEKDFDIALIAAGAFGMFLANYIKNKGKQAVHIGGALQLLFGIKGTRWNDELGYLYNDNWTSPLPEECPSDLTNFIKGEGMKAYW